MIQQQSYLDIADNSGAKVAMCIKVLRGSSSKGKFKRKVAHVGDVIICAVKKAMPGADESAKQGKIIFREARGMADRDAKIANTVDTRFRIGSMNKMFTATAVLQLVQAYDIDADTLVLIRPDGYIGMITQERSVGSVEEYLKF